MYIFLFIVVTITVITMIGIWLEGPSSGYQPTPEQIRKMDQSSRYMNDPVVRALEQLSDRNIF